MKFDDYVAILSTAYIVIPTSLVTNAKSTLQNSGVDFANPRALGKYSVAGTDDVGQEISFFDFCEHLAQEEVEGLVLGKATFPEEPGKRVWLTVQDYRVYVIKVITRKKERQFVIEIVEAPSIFATWKELLELMDMQTDQPRMRPIALKILQQHMRLNDLTHKDMTNVVSLLKEPDLWSATSVSILREIQIEIAAADQTFLMPDHLRPYFELPYGTSIFPDSKEDTELLAESQPKTEERIRRRAELIVSKSGYRFTRLKDGDRWTLYRLKPVPSNVVVEYINLEAVQVCENYRSCFNDLERLAKEILSPFSESFALAVKLLDYSKRDMSGESMNSDWESFVSWAEIKDYPQEGLANLESSYNFFVGLNVSKAKIFRVLSLQVSEVFGGMDSWNDQGGSQDDVMQSRLLTLSDNAFKAREALLELILQHHRT